MTVDLSIIIPIVAVVLLILSTWFLMFFKTWYHEDKAAKKDLHRLLVLHERELRPNDGKSLVDKVDRIERFLEEHLRNRESKKPAEN